MNRKKKSTKDTLGNVKARGEWLMASRWSRAPNQTVVKRGPRWSERAKNEEGETKRERERAISAKVNRPEVTFEEKSAAQVERNRWRRANHVKWECTSNGDHGAANARVEGRGWPSGGGSRAREPGTAKREGTKEGRELHCSTRPWITASTISRSARAIPFVRSSNVQVIDYSFSKERNSTCTLQIARVRSVDIGRRVIARQNDKFQEISGRISG